MANPQFIEEKPLSLVDVKSLLEQMEKRDKELNFLSNRTKEFVGITVALSPERKEELYKKLSDLKLTRLKEEHFMKIIDFLPKTTDELKVILQAYPLSLPKKDMEGIVRTVSEFTEQ